MMVANDMDLLDEKWLANERKPQNDCLDLNSPNDRQANHQPLRVNRANSIQRPCSTTRLAPPLVRRTVSNESSASASHSINEAVIQHSRSFVASLAKLSPQRKYARNPMPNHCLTESTEKNHCQHLFPPLESVHMVLPTWQRKEVSRLPQGEKDANALPRDYENTTQLTDDDYRITWAIPAVVVEDDHDDKRSVVSSLTSRDSPSFELSMSNSNLDMDTA